MRSNQGPHRSWEFWKDNKVAGSTHYQRSRRKRPLWSGPKMSYSRWSESIWIIKAVGSVSVQGVNNFIFWPTQAGPTSLAAPSKFIAEIVSNYLLLAEQVQFGTSLVKDQQAKWWKGLRSSQTSTIILSWLCNSYHLCSWMAHSSTQCDRHNALPKPRATINLHPSVMHSSSGHAITLQLPRLIYKANLRRGRELNDYLIQTSGYHQ